MPIAFDAGGSPLQTFDLQQMTEAAFVETGAQIDQQHDGQGAHTDVTLDSIGARTPGELVDVDAGLRFTLGPWILDGDGNPNSPTAAIRTDQITSTQHDYNPPGLATALVVELESDAARTISGIVTQRRRRLLQLVNRGNYTITLSHNSGSTAQYRFAFSGAVDFPLRSGGWVWLYYDTGSPIWRGESAGMALRSVQRDTIGITAGNTSNTDTLGTTLTDLTKCELRYLGHTCLSAQTQSNNVRLELTNTTTVTAFRSGTDEDLTVSYEVTEWG
jgi:hypothetical protein